MGQAPVLPHQGVYKQNLATDLLVGGVHDNTDALLTIKCLQPHLHSKRYQREDKWLVGQTGIFIHSLVTWLARHILWHAIWIKTCLYIAFYVVFCSCYHSVGEADPSILPTILGLLWQRTISCAWSHWIQNISDKTWHMWQPERLTVNNWIVLFAFL
jgi:predicted membrane-bound mannosyltransferase